MPEGSQVGRARGPDARPEPRGRPPRHGEAGGGRHLALDRGEPRGEAEGQVEGGGGRGHGQDGGLQRRHVGPAVGHPAQLDQIRRGEFDFRRRGRGRFARARTLLFRTMNASLKLLQICPKRRGIGCVITQSILRLF